MEKLRFKPSFCCTSDTMFLTHSRNLWVRGRADGACRMFSQAIPGASEIQNIKEMPERAFEKFSLCPLFWTGGERGSMFGSWRAAWVALKHDRLGGWVLTDGWVETDWETRSPKPDAIWDFSVTSTCPEETLSSNLFEPELNKAATICCDLSAMPIKVLRKHLECCIKFSLPNHTGEELSGN